MGSLCQALDELTLASAVIALKVLETLRILDLATGAWSAVLSESAGFSAWSRDSRYIYFTNSGNATRVGVPSGTPEIVAPLVGTDLTGNIAPWMGLTPDGAPMILRDLGMRDIYELQLKQ